MYCSAVCTLYINRAYNINKVSAEAVQRLLAIGKHIMYYTVRVMCSMCVCVCACEYCVHVYVLPFTSATNDCLHHLMPAPAADQGGGLSLPPGGTQEQLAKNGELLIPFTKVFPFVSLCLVDHSPSLTVHRPFYPCHALSPHLSVKGIQCWKHLWGR